MNYALFYTISILLGLIPEVLYFTLFITYTKNIKEKRFKLFVLTGIIYFLCMLVVMYKLVYYIAFVILFYLVLKFLYKQKIQIIDIFVITLSFFYLSTIAYIFFLLMNDNMDFYYLFYMLDRILLLLLLLFVPFIFKNKLNSIYKIYCKLWNRNDKETRPIKSITLRNISLIAINFIIIIMNIYIISIT